MHQKIASQAVFLWLGVLLCMAVESSSKGSGDSPPQTKVLFVVLSQPDSFHEKEAEAFRTRFQQQLSQGREDSRLPQLLFTHLDFMLISGAWTVFPLIGPLVERHLSSEFEWVFFCVEDTHVNVSRLESFLGGLDPSQDHFLGRELRDQHATIIHHFVFADNPSQFAYPDFRAGFVLSAALVHRLHERLQTSKLKTDFSIDPKHELALFLWDNDKGTRLTHVPEFCSVDEREDPECITFQPSKFVDCGPAIKKENLFVAVKTCEQFHKSRVPIVQATWGKEASLMEFYSETEDKSIPTVSLGVPNTERGHCGKTMAIIKRVLDTPKLLAADWILIADDDTIINLGRLRSLLACYNSRQPIALGEVYGYGVARGGGYNYITGGGGMVFTQPALRLLRERCSCYSDDAPDDMTLGMCLKSMGISLTNSRFFHQARPEDYSKDYLANQQPISFHKHWNNDPLKVYADLLHDEPSRSTQDRVQSESRDTVRQEL